MGAIKKLMEVRPEIEFDILSGGGAGSLIIPLVALKETDPLIEIFTTKHNRDVIKKFSMSERIQEASILDASPLWSLLDHYYNHSLYKRLCASGKELYFNTMCLQTHAMTVFSPSVDPAITPLYAQRCFENYDQFLRVLLACACQPVLLPPIRIFPQEEPIRQYIDAGPREYAGIEMAILTGATEVFVLLQSPITHAVENKEYHDLYTILQEALDIFTADTANNLHITPNLYNEGLRYIQEVKKKIMQQGIPAATVENWFDTGMMDNPFYNKRPVRLHIIRPDLPLGGGPDGLTFDPTLMQEMLAKGELAMEAHLALGGSPAPNTPSSVSSSRPTPPAR